MRDFYKEAIKALEEDHFFDFVCQNYYLMSRYELKDLLKETIYTAHQLKRYLRDAEFNQYLIENIQENLIREEKEDFTYVCPECGAETVITDYEENESFVFCNCKIDKHGDGVVMIKKEDN